MGGGRVHEGDAAEGEEGLSVPSRKGVGGNTREGDSGFPTGGLAVAGGGVDNSLKPRGAQGRSEERAGLMSEGEAVEGVGQSRRGHKNKAKPSCDVSGRAKGEGVESDGRGWGG